MKQLKSNFNSYNLFLDVILLHNMVNVLLIAQILRFHHQNERVRIRQYSGENGSAWSAILVSFADQVTAVVWCKAFIKANVFKWI